MLWKKGNGQFFLIAVAQTQRSTCMPKKCLLACLPFLLNVFISVAVAAAIVIFAAIRLQHLWGSMWAEDGQLSQNLPSPWIGSLGTNQLYGQLLGSSSPQSAESHCCITQRPNKFPFMTCMHSICVLLYREDWDQASSTWWNPHDLCWWSCKRKERDHCAHSLSLEVSHRSMFFL